MIIMRCSYFMRFQQPFPVVIPLCKAGYPRVTHPSATKSLYAWPEGFMFSASFDLHVLGTPPAFILSQDQTLMFKFVLFQDYTDCLLKKQSSISFLLFWFVSLLKFFLNKFMCKFIQLITNSFYEFVFTNSFYEFVFTNSFTNLFLLILLRICYYFKGCFTV